uniref:Pentraxin family member n=1 Tax=Suricata suricatta TaxID=37032 RepID=A0A673TQ88_SURSU
MDKLLLWVSALPGNLSGKVFVFPQESSTHHVTLTPKLESPLKNFTLCFRAYSDLPRAYSLFSYNTPSKENELLIFTNEVGNYILYIRRTKVTFVAMETVPSPVHICTSWESSTGIAEFWVNWKPLVKKGLKQGYVVQGHPKIVLGQEQDSYGGKLGDLYMWDSVLSPEQIRSVWQGSYLPANVLDWRALTYEIKGYVIVKPLVWS